MTPIILDFLYPADFIRYVVQSCSLPTTFIIGHDRDSLLEQLCLTLSNNSGTTHNAEGCSTGPEDNDLQSRDPLLCSPLQLIARSKNIKLLFCPKIDVARALLSGKLPASPGQGRSILAVLDLVALHHGTTEFSVQGLSRTFASLAESAARSGMDLILNECKDVHDLDNPYRGPKMWDAQVPLLSGSVKLPGEGSRWAGRVIFVRRIAERWFTFTRVPVAAKEPDTPR